MNDERLSTAGSLRMTRAKRLLTLRHGGEGDSLWRFGDAEYHAGVLHREKTLRDVNVQQHGAHQRRGGDP